ncbi:MAG: single-stranded DNA-binding protein [Candidatus Onthoplasma sp.]
MNNEIENNKVFIQGYVENEPEFNHKVKDDEFYSFNLKVPRLSGQFDMIPIIISKQLLDVHCIKKGDKIALHGQFRSHNKLDGEKRKLILSVFVKSVEPWDENVNSNIVELDGYICKPSIYRTTPFSREICDVLLAVNRNFNKSDYIPCIAWGANALVVSKMPVATSIKILGRIQSREYNKQTENGIETKTAYEVSISQLLN